jgi:hypothetical protein
MLELLTEIADADSPRRGTGASRWGAAMAVEAAGAGQVTPDKPFWANPSALAR